MWQKLEVVDEPTLRKPVLLICVSTSNPQYRALYSQARELASYLLKRVEFKKFASLYTSALPPAVLVRDDGVARLVADHFYRHSLGDRDLVLFAGDSSPVDEQYEFCDAILTYAKKLGVKEVISVGTRWNEQLISPLEVPKVLGFASDEKGVEELKGYGVTITPDEPAPFFASLIIGLTSLYGMRGYKLAVNHGEPIPHPKSLMQILSVLADMLGLKVDMKELEDQAKELPEMIKEMNVEGEEGGAPTAGRNIYH